MAVILEVTGPDGTRSRIPIERLPLTIGRAVANDVVLDDPYADAFHAQLTSDGESLVVEDRGSVNRLRRAGEPERVPRLALRAGEAIRVGRSTIRLRDTGEMLPPALRDGDDAATIAEDVQRQRGDVIAPGWACRPAVQLMIIAGGLAAISLSTWLSSYERSVASEVFAASIGMGLGLALWAGIWSVAGRIVVHRFNFLGHMAVAAAAATGALAYLGLDEWLNFLLPDSGASSFLSIAVSFMLTSAVICGHLALASRLRPLQRWRAGLLVAGSVLVIGGLATLVEEDTFTDIPSFSGTLKPLTPNWLPAETVDQFGAVMHDLKVEADRLAQRP